MTVVRHGAAATGAWVLLAAVAAATVPSRDPPENLRTLREAALMLANADREEHGLTPLRPDATLAAAAQRHAEDMLARGYFAHASPDGRTVVDRYRAAGGTGSPAIGENLANCTRCGPPRRALLERFESGWMESPGHRRNLLDPGFDRFGLGIAAGPDGRVYAVQTFAGPGEPPETAAGRAATPLEPDAVAALAARLINAARREAGVAPLTASPALTAATRRLLDRGPGEPLAGIGGLPPGRLFEAVPAEDRRFWEVVSVLAGECGGCGREPTDADVEFFRERWLAAPEYRRSLLDSTMTHLGFAMTADGQGRKLALAMIGRRR